MPYFHFYATREEIAEVWTPFETRIEGTLRGVRGEQTPLTTICDAIRDETVDGIFLREFREAPDHDLLWHRGRYDGFLAVDFGRRSGRVWEAASISYDDKYLEFGDIPAKPLWSELKKALRTVARTRLCWQAGVPKERMVYRPFCSDGVLVLLDSGEVELAGQGGWRFCRCEDDGAL